MGEVVGGTGDKWEPQDSFLRAATLFGHPRWPWKWEDILPSIVLLQPLQWIWHPVCSGQANWPPWNNCSQWDTWLQNTHLKVRPVKETWRLRLLQLSLNVASVCYMENEESNSQAGSLCKKTLLPKTFPTCYENVTRTAVGQYVDRKCVLHCKQLSSESLSCWNQLRLPAQPVMYTTAYPVSISNNFTHCFCLLHTLHTEMSFEAVGKRPQIFTLTNSMSPHPPELLAFGK